MSDITVTAWGVRGSYPVAEAEFLGYGGNTTCFSLRRGSETVIFDAGTGLLELGKSMGEEGEARLFLSHAHLDHIQGLPSFAPLMRPDFTLHIYGGDAIRARLETMIGAPYWPLSLGEYPARVEYHEIAPGDDVDLPGGGTVRVFRGNHPGGCVHFRAELDGRVLFYALDCETDGNVLETMTPQARDADLMIWDASYTPEDLKPGWGHSTARAGAELARRAGVRHVWMSHYSPAYDDGRLRQIEAGFRDGRCVFTKEGMEIVL